MTGNIDKYELEIAWLKKELEKYKTAVAELNTLNDLSISAGKSSDVDQMLSIIVKKTTKYLDAEQGSIMLVTENQDKQVKTYLVQKEMTTSRRAYHIGTVITGWVLRYEEALIIDDLSKDKRFDFEDENSRHIHSLLCVPLWFEGKIIGLLTMINKKGEKQFSKNDLTLLSIISVQAGQLIKNLELQKQAFEKQKETEKLHELDRIKTNFFNNISHEFRSPLTLILGPLENLMSSQLDEIYMSDLNLIHRNAHRLLKLINQLLDIATIDAGKMKLIVEKGDLISFVSGIITYYSSLAESKIITINLTTNISVAESYFDKDKMEKIITNLLSNSLKFTGEGGNVSISINDLMYEGEEIRRMIELSIQDDGIGISTVDLKNIFNRFSKAEQEHTDEGTGIGLALVKELIDLHYGTISVESELKKGTKFTIRIPVNKQFYIDHSIEIQSSKERGQNEIGDGRFYSTDKVDNKNSEHDDTDLPIILIVEDQSEIRNFIRDSLISSNRIIEASNGTEGLEKCFENIPDLVISDLLMPGMDGLKLTEKIKEDIKTSHIPVILLTARATIESKLKGLLTGADDYLTKPFNVAELKTRVNNLIKQRMKLRELFRKEIKLEPKNIAITSIDEKFLSQAMDVLEKHISNSEFSVEQFASELYMSRVQLHRKLIALSEQSPGEFIRTFRLLRAAKLLLNKHGNISEIAYDVGFKTPSYFTEAFGKFYGCSPLEYYKSHQNTKS